MHKIIPLLLFALIFLCSCFSKTMPQSSDSLNPSSDIFSSISEDTNTFIENEDGILIDSYGNKYAYIGNEEDGLLDCLGSLEYAGPIQGEVSTSSHLEHEYTTGMFSIKEDENDTLLIRYLPENEWVSFYYKLPLPSSFSIDECSRFEVLTDSLNEQNLKDHTACSGGLCDPLEIETFISDIQSQPSPEEANLYELIHTPNGLLENCYIYGNILGYFENESHLVIQMPVTSYNDLAYSVSIGNKVYVLPDAWLSKLQHSQ